MAVKQPRTHSIAKMHFPGDHFSTGWWWHFALFSSGLLEEENRKISKMLFFPVVLEWRCSCQLVLSSQIPCLNVTVGGQMWLSFKGRSDNCDYDLYHLTLNKDEQIFYRNNPWGSQKPSSPPGPFFFWVDLVLLSSQNLLLLRRESKWHLNVVRLEKKPFSYHIPPHWLCLHNTRMQQCSLIFKASPAQSDQQFVLHVWVSRCSHMASGICGGGYSWSSVRDNIIFYSQLWYWLLNTAYI